MKTLNTTNGLGMPEEDTPVSYSQLPARFLEMREFSSPIPG